MMYRVIIHHSFATAFLCWKYVPNAIDVLWWTEPYSRNWSSYTKARVK